MNLIKRDNRMYPAVNSIFDNFFIDDIFDMPRDKFHQRNDTMPAVNIVENNNEFLIEVAAPGFNKDDFKIELDKNILSVSSVNEEKEEENTNYSCKEFIHHSFNRKFTLPEAKVNKEKIGAKYVNGILYVTIPKREEENVKPARMIKIS